MAKPQKINSVNSSHSPLTFLKATGRFGRNTIEHLLIDPLYDTARYRYYLSKKGLLGLAKRITALVGSDCLKKREVHCMIYAERKKRTMRLHNKYVTVPHYYKIINVLRKDQSEAFASDNKTLLLRFLKHHYQVLLARPLNYIINVTGK